MANLLNKVKDKMFESVHTNNLIYNTCWEDSAIDRELMEIDENSKIVMITSAGDNALDYLLDNPETVHAVDMNPRQNSLLELKKAIFKSGDFPELFATFGRGYYKNFPSAYQQRFRNELPEFAKKYWDKKKSYFYKRGMKKSFYFHGTSGTFAWLFNKYLSSKPKAKKMLYQLLHAKSLAEQKRIWADFEPMVITKFVKWMMNRHMTMALLGVPTSQRQLIRDQYPGKMAGFVSDSLRHVFTDLDISNNFYWYLYVAGRYRKDCAPNYLREENFEALKSSVDNLKTYTSTISNFLEQNPEEYTHFVLLDHQDWLAANNIVALEEEWYQILKNSKPGTKILMRSAALEVDFIPEFAMKSLKFETEKSQVLHKTDRVGTYASVTFAEVI